ncbi:MAG: helix-turn-helix domain-containing protein [Gemmatimonadales bacterium]|nr:helix-turn-helix domain-containing protein [Gemmatimonadales bacterium]MBT3497634.1 helix-turn-helix domain-containing protein [Gemmatimonadales bacterium]MBT6694314.1 helix-turn-helix domain-containing protein [Gemmatimonadales bacterium]MBT7692693.1 helix-turn-helix domain-containing protein [Gemmatimonadales bacterium]
MTEPEYISATEAARRLGISDTAIRKRIKRGTISASKVGREWRISVAELPDSSVTEPNHNHDGSATESDPHVDGSLTEPTAALDMPEGVPTEPPDGELSSVTEPREFGDRTNDAGPEPSQFGGQASPDVEDVGEDDDSAHPLESEDAPPVGRYEREGIEVENKLLRLKLESVEREHQATQRHLESVLGEIDHLRTVNERLSIAVTNEQVLRLGSSPQAEAIETQPTDVAPEDDLPEPPAEDSRDDPRTSVTIRGSKPRGWLFRVFGAK